MKLKKITCFSAFVFLSTIFTNEIKAQNLTSKQFIEDLEFLKTELPKNHKNLFFNISEKDFNKKIQEIEKKSNSLNNNNFEIELYKLIKEIGDEHTRIEPLYEDIFPLHFDFFKEGIFVTETDSANSDLLYKKLNGIEKQNTKMIIRNFNSIIKNDNSSYFSVYFQKFINNPKVLNGLNITKSIDETDYILDGNKIHITTIPKENYVSKNENNLLKYSRKDNYWYQFLNDEKVLYFNYQSCSEEQNYSFKSFCDKLFNEIENKKPEKIIIDLRNNEGGNSGILDPFLEKLKNNDLNKKGSLFVLIGKHTFSSALMNAVDLKRNYHSILIGESTSGNVNHYGESRGFRLPNSKIIVGYSTKYWETWKGYKGALIPDIAIEYSIYNFKNNIDKAIDYVLNYQ